MEEQGIAYRWRTLLQFGQSWNFIGSVVMKNPGSAYPVKEVELQELSSIDNSSPWYEFNNDTTMTCIEEFFKGYFKTNHLNGIIQIFNLFNIREANLEKALALYEKDCKSSLEQDLKSLTLPAYLGWSTLGKDTRFRPQAIQFFEAVKEKSPYLKANFDDNPFFHPLYLMRYGRNREKAKEVRTAFQS